MSLITGITGLFVGRNGDSAHIRVGGITFAVTVPLPEISMLQINEEVSLFTHFIVREEDMSLYGFVSSEERDLFTKLLNVSGVGARLSIALVSTHTVEALCRAIINEDLDRLTRTPGVGKKLAQRLVLELKTPITKFLEGLPDLPGESTQREIGQGPAAKVRERDIIDAVAGLGYSANEVQAALRFIPDASDLSLDQVIVKVLRVLAQ